MPIDAAADILLQFDGGATANIHISALSWEPGQRQLYLRVDGEKGQVECDVLRGYVRVVNEAGVFEEVPRRPSMGYEEEIRFFLDAIAAGGEPFVHDDYVETLRVVEGIYRAFVRRDPTLV
jgi:predicted dehydrogenase